MKIILFTLLLGIVACSNKKQLAVEDSIKTKVNGKGYSVIKGFDMVSDNDRGESKLFKIELTQAIL